MMPTYENLDILIGAGIVQNTRVQNISFLDRGRGHENGSSSRIRK